MSNVSRAPLCKALTKAGEPCKNPAKRGHDVCTWHGAGDFSEIGRKAGIASGQERIRRSVRERFREDAERMYDTLLKTVQDAIEAEVVRWGECQNCKHKVAVSFPDIRSRTQAIQLLLDQGYGRPPQAHTGPDGGPIRFVFETMAASARESRDDDVIDAELVELEPGEGEAE